MSKELPEYERRQGITPADGAGSFTQAIAGVAQSFQSISDIGVKVAQSASNEIATLRGIEAGKNPGRKLMPAFTESDKHFVEAYKQQEYAIASTQGADLLRKLGFEASKNPTPGSLLDYEKNAQQGLEGILGTVTPGTEASLRKVFADSYSAHYYQLAQNVENQNNHIMKQNIKLFLDDRIKQIQDLRSNDDNEAADALKKDTQEKLKAQSGNLVLTEPEAREYADVLQKIDEIAEAKRDIDRADTIGLAERALAEEAKKPQTAENLRRSSAMLEAYKNRKSLESMQNSLLLEDSIRRLEANELGPMDVIDLQGQMNVPTFSKFRREAEQHFRRQAALQNDFYGIEMNAQNPAALANFSGETRDKFLDFATKSIIQISNAQGRPAEDNLLTRATVASNYKMSFPTLTKQLSNSINYGDVAQATEASRAVRMLQNNNPAAIEGLDTNAKAVAKVFDLYSRNTSYSGEDSLKAARDDVYNVDEAKRKERLEGYNQWKKDKSLNEYQKKLDFIAKGIGATKGFFNSPDRARVPAGLSVKYDELMQSMVTRVPDPELASSLVFDELKTVYKPTNINNRDTQVFSELRTVNMSTYNGDKKEIMAFPPEDNIWMRNDKVRAIKELVDTNEAMRQKGAFVMNELSWPDAPNLDDMLSKELVDGDVKIMIDGKLRKIVVVSDDQTQLSPSGQPSWGLSYIDDNGLELPLMDINSKTSVARWIPDYKNLALQQQAYEDRQLKKAAGAKETQKEIDKLAADLALDRY